MNAHWNTLIPRFSHNKKIVNTSGTDNIKDLDVVIKHAAKAKSPPIKRKKQYVRESKQRTPSLEVSPHSSALEHHDNSPKHHRSNSRNGGGAMLMDIPMVFGLLQGSKTDEMCNFPG